MDANDLSLGRFGGIGLGVYLFLAGAATLVGMPWQYADGGVVLAVLRILGGVIAVVGGVALVWLAVNAGEEGRATPQ